MERLELLGGALEGVPRTLATVTCGLIGTLVLGATLAPEPLMSRTTLPLMLLVPLADTRTYDELLFAADGDVPMTRAARGMPGRVGVDIEAGRVL